MVDPEIARGHELVGIIARKKSTHLFMGTIGHTFNAMGATLLRVNLTISVCRPAPPTPTPNPPRPTEPSSQTNTNAPGPRRSRAVDPSLAEYEDLLDPQTYAGLDFQRGEKLLSCVEEQEDNIRNILDTPLPSLPEVSQGLYYHTEMHLIQQNIAEFQFRPPTLPGIGALDRDVPPPPNALVDGWHANVMGDYAGHPFPAPSLINEMPATEKGIEDGGAWPTNARGVAQLSSIFPGYYTSRVLHIYTKVFKARRLARTGQLFFDGEMWPYSTNPIRNTPRGVRNWNNGLNIFNDFHGPKRHYDPVFKLEKLRAIIDQGLAGFITMVCAFASSFYFINLGLFAGGSLLVFVGGGC
ncbi:hypothetical protein FIBSPDRAFT_964914 [Athelia psychrophila]|uniref:Uncharacterized protein n=1 Tax=Athelia psychrophila TaxID=1759441 RepID=A0A165X7L2_9AGAM|nr:hypothetical protein FIBSPDRAFT_964914 [Fibularhizoctonia sp. CBS 109695]